MERPLVKRTSGMPISVVARELNPSAILALCESQVLRFNAANVDLSFELETMEQQGGTLMDTDNELTPLRVALVAVGIIFIFGIYPWPSLRRSL